MEGLLNIFEERIGKKSDTIFDERIAARQQFRIATSATVPIVNTIFGRYINPFCHILDSLSIVHPLISGKPLPTSQKPLESDPNYSGRDVW